MNSKLIEKYSGIFPSTLFYEQDKYYAKYNTSNINYKENYIPFNEYKECLQNCVDIYQCVQFHYTILKPHVNNQAYNDFLIGIFLVTQPTVIYEISLKCLSRST